MLSGILKQRELLCIIVTTSKCRADAEKFIHFEADDWYVISQTPEGSPEVAQLEPFSEKRENEIRRTYDILRG